MYTGKYATEHGATLENRVLSTDVTTLAELLKNAGIKTGVFTGNLYLSETFGVQRGFEYADFMKGRGTKYFSEGFDPSAFLTRQGVGHDLIKKYVAISNAILDGPIFKNLANAVYAKIRSNDNRKNIKKFDIKAVSSAKDFIHQQVNMDNRFFSVVNLLGAHEPWSYDYEKLRAIDIEPTDIAPVERWKQVANYSSQQWQYAAGDLEFSKKEEKMLELLYESWVHGVDKLAGELVNFLAEINAQDDTLIIITSDHGHMICENDVLGHNVTLDESMTHVPLVMDGPTVGQKVIDHPVSLKDIYGTILSRTGVASVETTLSEKKDHVISETHGSDPDRVSKTNSDYPDLQNIQRYFQKRRALFTKNSWIEKIYDSEEIRGDESLLSSLDKAVSELDISNLSRKKPTVEKGVQERLKNLGYAE
jgi:uncharacterized sulfatase